MHKQQNLFFMILNFFYEAIKLRGPKRKKSIPISVISEYLENDMLNAARSKLCALASNNHVYASCLKVLHETLWHYNTCTKDLQQWRQEFLRPKRVGNKPKYWCTPFRIVDVGRVTRVLQCKRSKALKGSVGHLKNVFLIEQKVSHKN